MLTSSDCNEGGAGRHRGQGRGSGARRMAAGVEVVVGGGVWGCVEVGGGGGVEGAESARRPTGDGGGDSGEGWTWGKWSRGEGRTPWLSQK